MKSVQGFAQRSDTETLHESFRVHGILYLLHMKTVLHSRCLLKAKLGTESAKKIEFHNYFPLLPSCPSCLSSWARPAAAFLSAGAPAHILHLKVQFWGLMLWIFTCTMVNPCGQNHPSVPFIPENPSASRSSRPHPPSTSLTYVPLLLHQPSPALCSTPARNYSVVCCSAFEQESQIKSRFTVLYELQGAEADLRCWDPFG